MRPARKAVGRLRTGFLFRLLLLLLVVLFLDYCGTPSIRHLWALPGFGRSSADSLVELVVASVKSDNTSWINEYFPQYPANIYVTDDPNALLTVPRNKGRESAAYLT